jgi:hypothetical protein
MHMPRNISIALIVLLLAGLTAFVLWPEASPDQGPAGSKQIDNPQDFPATTANSEASAGDSESALVARTEATPATKPASVNGILPAYDGSDGVVISIVDQETGQPAPFADLYLVDGSTTDLGTKNMAYRYGASVLNPLCRKQGRHYQSDSQGKIVVPRPEKFMLALAEKDGLFGFEDQHGDRVNEIEIRLRPNRTFEVQVIDAAGAPVADVPVSLQEGEKTRVFTKVTVQSNAEGVANFEDLDQNLLATSRYGSVFCTLGVPMRLQDITQSQRVKLTDELLGIGKVVLTLPPIGHVRFKLLDSQGQLDQGLGGIRIEFPEGDPSFGVDIRPRVKSQDGIAEFYWVGLHTQMRAKIWGAGSRNPDLVMFDGPTRDNEWVEVTVQLTPHSFLKGRILSPEGQPIPNQAMATLETTSAGYGSRTRNFRADTDAEGRYQFELDLSDPDGPALGRSIRFRIDSKEFGRYQWAQDLPIKFEPGAFDLGDITMINIPVLLRGLVEDQTGAPIHRAMATLEYADDQSQGNRVWRTASELNGTTGRDGEFVVFGKLPDASDFRLRIGAKGYETLVTTPLFGDQLQKFELPSGAVLIGALHIDEAIKFYNLKVIMRRGSDKQSLKLEPDGPGLANFQYEGNSNIPYSFEIRTPQDELVYEMNNLVLASGKETRPPELQPLDLRPLLRVSKFDVRNTAGVRIDAKIIAKGGARSHTYTNDGGPIVAYSMSEFDQVTVSAVGYLSKTLHNSASEQTVVLENAIKVYVTVPAELVRHREARLTLEAEPDRYPALDFFNFDSKGRATLYVPEFGNYRLRARVNDATHHRFNSNFLLADSKYLIENSGQVIELPVDLAALNAMIDEMRDGS